MGAPGGDDVTGGDGFDLFRYETYGPGAASITLDGESDDGLSGEGDNIHSDVEDVAVTGPGNATVEGSSAFNSLTTGSGADSIDSEDGAPGLVQQRRRRRRGERRRRRRGQRGLRGGHQ